MKLELQYNGSRGTEAADFVFHPKLAEWTGPDCSLVRRGGWFVSTEDDVRPCTMTPEGTMCGEWLFRELDVAPPPVDLVGDVLTRSFPHLLNMKLEHTPLIKQMNQWGPSICEMKCDTIVAAMMANPQAIIDQHKTAPLVEMTLSDGSLESQEFFDEVTSLARLYLSHACEQTQERRRVSARHSNRSSKRTQQRSLTRQTRIDNVGSCMTKRIKGFLKIRDTAGCKCKAYATRMNTWGPDGCEKRRKEIVDHLMTQSDMIADAIVSTSIPGCGLLARLIGTPAATPLLKLGANWLLDESIKDARKNIAERKHSPQWNVATRINNPPPVPFPFTEKPKLVLISHCWPRGSAWEYHVERLNQIAHQFDRKIMGIATDSSTVGTAEVRKQLGDDWEFVEVANTPKLREVVTYRSMFDQINSDDPNQIVFCHHAKGVQDHNQGQDPIRWWTDAMYDSVLCNVDGVVEAMANGATFVGSFRRMGRMMGVRHAWHFSGTFYAFRSARVFPLQSYPLRNVWWGTEAWPGDHFSVDHSHCIVGDNIGDMYQANHQPREEMDQWRAKRVCDHV